MSVNKSTCELHWGPLCLCTSRTTASANTCTLWGPVTVTTIWEPFYSLHNSTLLFNQHYGVYNSLCSAIIFKNTGKQLPFEHPILRVPGFSG